MSDALITTSRPETLREVARRTDSLETFGRELQDWLHTLRSVHSRPALAAAITDEPSLLAPYFPGGRTADAWLAAYAEHLATTFTLPVPSWTRRAARVAPEPVFASDTPALRRLALRDSPAAFKNRNLYTPAVDLPVHLRRGRPTLPIEQRRATNAERQRRFRERRKQELIVLRTRLRAAR